MNSYYPLLFSRVAILSLLLALVGTFAAAQEQPLRSITYQLSMSRPTSHLFEVAIEVELPENANVESLDFRMAKWSQVDPVGLVIDPPAGWRIINGLMKHVDQREWRFPNWDIMIDTPTEIAPEFQSAAAEVAGSDLSEFF